VWGRFVAATRQFDDQERGRKRLTETSETHTLGANRALSSRRCALAGGCGNQPRPAASGHTSAQRACPCPARQEQDLRRASRDGGASVFWRISFAKTRQLTSVVEDALWGAGGGRSGDGRWISRESTRALIDAKRRLGHRHATIRARGERFVPGPLGRCCRKRDRESFPKDFGLKTLGGRLRGKLLLRWGRGVPGSAWRARPSRRPGGDLLVTYRRMESARRDPRRPGSCPDLSESSFARPGSGSSCCARVRRDRAWRATPPNISAADPLNLCRHRHSRAARQPASQEWSSRSGRTRSPRYTVMDPRFDD